MPHLEARGDEGKGAQHMWQGGNGGHQGGTTREQGQVSRHGITSPPMPPSPPLYATTSPPMPPPPICHHLPSTTLSPSPLDHSMSVHKMQDGSRGGRRRVVCEGLEGVCGDRAQEEVMAYDIRHMIMGERG